MIETKLYSKTKISPERFQRHTYVHMGRKEGRKEGGRKKLEPGEIR